MCSSDLIIRIKKPKNKLNVDNNEENVYEKIILLDAKHDDNIVLMELISEDNEKILLF